MHQLIVGARGDTNAIEIALSKGLVSWQGLVHNIDYLDLDDGIKRVVGKWWRKWIKTESQVGTGGNGVGSQIGRRSNAGPSEEWFDGDGDGDEQPSPLSPTGGKDDVTDGDEADVEEDALSGNVLGKKGKEATMEKQRDQAKDSAGMKAKRWVRGNGDLDEGMVGRLRNL